MLHRYTEQTTSAINSNHTLQPGVTKTGADDNRGGFPAAPAVCSHIQAAVCLILPAVKPQINMNIPQLGAF